MNVQLLSWNIWIKGNFRQTAEFLKNSDADIIGLQEVLPDDRDRDIVGFLNKSGYQHVFAPVEHNWRGKKLSDGPALFTKHNIIDSKIHILSQEEPRAAVQASIEIGDLSVNVFSTHLVHTHQKPSDTQDGQVSSLLKLLPGKRTIVMGDFNSTVDSTVIKKMRFAFVDSDLKKQPTWCLYADGCEVCKLDKVKIKLDYIFVSHDIKVIDFNVGKSKASDHLPIMAELEI